MRAVTRLKQGQKREAVWSLTLHPSCKQKRRLWAAALQSVLAGCPWVERSRFEFTRCEATNARPLLLYPRKLEPVPLTPNTSLYFPPSCISALPLSYMDDSAVSTAQWLVDGEAVYGAYAAAIKGKTRHDRHRA